MLENVGTPVTAFTLNPNIQKTITYNQLTNFMSYKVARPTHFLIQTTLTLFIVTIMCALKAPLFNDLTIENTLKTLSCTMQSGDFTWSELPLYPSDIPLKGIAKVVSDPSAKGHNKLPKEI